MKKIIGIAITIIILIIIIFLFKNNYKKIKSGNNISNKSIDEIKEYILNIESYSANAKVEVESNKIKNTYIVEQRYIKEGNLYKQKVLEPENLSGIEFTYDGKDLNIKNSKLTLNKIYADYKFMGSNELSLTKFIEDYKNNEKTKIYINPTGRFVLGGPVADSGLTGRKIIVDTYGGYARHGGGAFSGKDPSKVDRSASYYARYVAKNIVAANLCDKIEIQVSYAIGVSKPVAIYINTFNTNKISEEKILEIINKVFNFEPSNIIKVLDLKKPIYHLTTCFGHFGKEILPWEKLDKVDSIKALKD